LKGGDVRDALKSHINILAAKGFKITKLISDGGFSTLTEYINSREIIHETVGAGSHVSIVENKIKCIKNRSILASLPYHLPVSLYPHLCNTSSAYGYHKELYEPDDSIRKFHGTKD
jgi:hypothetical protein